jgi:hypothetical protein
VFVFEDKGYRTFYCANMLDFISLRFPGFGGKTEENLGKPKPGLSNPGEEFNSEMSRIKVSTKC